MGAPCKTWDAACLSKRAENAPLRLQGKWAATPATRGSYVLAELRGYSRREADSILRQRSACPQGEFDAG